MDKRSASLIHKKTGSANFLGAKSGRMPKPITRPKPATRPWSEPPMQLDSADLISARPPPAPPRAPLDLVLDLDIEVADPSSTTSWTGLELANPSPKGLAPPLLPGFGGAFEPGLSSTRYRFRLGNKLTRTHRMWVAGVITMALGATGAWSILGVARGRSPLVANSAITSGSALELREDHVAKPSDPAKSDRASDPGDEGTLNAPATLPDREGPTDVAGAVVKTKNASPVAARAGKLAPTVPTAQESETAMSKATKAKSIPSDPEEHAALAKRAAVARNPSIPAADPSTTEAPVTPPPPVGGFDATGDFDRNAAMQALREAGDTARGCVTGGPPAGGVRVAVTFARTGSVADTVVEGPLAGTPSATCIAGKFRSLRVPPFRGSSMTVRKTITF
jgi:hypothetical protein